MKKIKVGIFGGAGYTAGELLRILLLHPHVTVVSVVSTTQAGKPISETHTDVLGLTDLKFSDKISRNIDVIFLCVEHGVAGKILKEHHFFDGQKVIDLSNEFRVKPHHRIAKKTFVYGAPALYKTAIKKTSCLANPGCFATAIELALLPLAHGGCLKEKNDIHVHAITGSTGAGISQSAASHFSWRHSNVSFYKEFTHQHLAEIKQLISEASKKPSPEIYFLPMRGNFTRGILAGVYVKMENPLDQIKKLYHDFFRQRDEFVHISSQPISLKQVINTNHCVLHLQRQDDILLITSVIDNLLKGASGQAVQNMNIMFGLEENLGLKLKAVAF